jgi:SAM-dependent methyltransferase
VRSPWLDIPLSDYEGHMALPEVGQASLLADVFEAMLREYRPRSVAVLGCAGGNGFERIPAAIARVVGVDLNPEYVAALRERFQGRIPGLEAIEGDLQSDAVSFAPVDLAFAGLLFEYVDVEPMLRRIRRLLTAGGVLGVVVQLPSGASAPVTPTPFASLRALASSMRLVPPERLDGLARAAGYRAIARRRVTSAGRKEFEVRVFRSGGRGATLGATGELDAGEST